MADTNASETTPLVKAGSPSPSPSPAAAPAPAPAAAPAETTAVFVSNISPSAAEKTVADFFSFCGEIRTLVLRKAAGVEDGTQEAIVAFESAAAAKTAQLLTNALIVDRAIAVRAYSAESDAQPGDTAAAARTPVGERRDFGGATDSQRSKTSVIASMLAAGYVMGDDVKRRAIDYDSKHRITAQIAEKASEIDQSLGITAKFQHASEVVGTKLNEVDQRYGLTVKAQSAANAVKTEAEKLAARASENPTFNSAMAALKSFGTTVSNSYEALMAETNAQIDAKMQERGQLLPPAPAAAAAPETAAPATTEAAAQPPLYPKLDEEQAKPAEAEAAAPAAEEKKPDVPPQ